MKSKVTSWIPRIPGKAGAWLAVVLLSLAASRISAAVLAADDFESYTAGQALSGQNGGTGWAGAWLAPVGSTTNDVVDTTANPLVFTPAGGTTIGGQTRAGRAWSTVNGGAGNNPAAARQLAAPLNSTVYARFLVRYETTTTGSFSNNNTFSLHGAASATTTTNLNFGLRAGASTNHFMVRNGTGAPLADDVLPLVVENGVTYLLVARFVYAGSGKFNTLDMWLNPAYSESGTPDLSLTIADGVSLSSITHLFFRSAANEADDRFLFDNLVVATTWDEVVPPAAVPLINVLAPTDGNLGWPAANGISFTASSPLPIQETGVSLILNAVDVSGGLVITGTENNRAAVYEGLAADTYYQAQIVVSNGGGVATNILRFGTFDPATAVVIETPTNGAFYASGADIPVLVKAEALQAIIAQVRVSAVAYESTNLLATLTNAPFGFTWSNVTDGAYLLLAEAVTEEGYRMPAQPAAILVGTPPQPALLIAGAVPLSAGDQSVANRLQALGLPVVTLPAAAAQPQDADGKRLVVVSSTVLSTDVGSKFTTSAVPVIQWEQALVDDFLISAAGLNLNDQVNLAITAAGAAHPLGAGLPAGTVTVRDTPTQFHLGRDTSLAPGAVVIARAATPTNTLPAIIGVDAGALLNNGAPAPARRVHMCWGDEGLVGVTADGVALFDAAVQWAIADLPPRWTLEPASRLVQEGETVTLTAAADGTAPIGYFWLFNGVPVPGAEQPSLELGAVQFGDAGDYQVAATNGVGAITSQVAVLTVNRPPAPQNQEAGAWQNQATPIPVAKFLQNASDPDGDVVSLLSVSNLSTNGGSVTHSNDVVWYVPVQDFQGVDRFGFTISDGRGGQAGAYVHLQVLPAQGHNQVRLVALPGGVQIHFAGIPGRNYEIQRSVNLADWETLTNLTAAANGGLMFEDVNPPPPQAFYRTRTAVP